jgi:hypothetical protein
MKRSGIRECITAPDSISFHPGYKDNTVIARSDSDVALILPGAKLNARSAAHRANYMDVICNLPTLLHIDRRAYARDDDKKDQNPVQLSFIQLAITYNHRANPEVE